jgi:hypothetical protein
MPSYDDICQVVRIPDVEMQRESADFPGFVRIKQKPDVTDVGGGT